MGVRFCTRKCSPKIAKVQFFLQLKGLSRGTLRDIASPPIMLQARALPRSCVFWVAQKGQEPHPKEKEGQVGTLVACSWVHQNRASPFASDFCRRRGYRREFRSESHFYPFYSQKKSRFASDLLRRGNRTPWGLKKSRDFLWSGKNRRRSRRESRDFGALRPAGVNEQGVTAFCVAWRLEWQPRGPKD